MWANLMQSAVFTVKFKSSEYDAVQGEDLDRLQFQILRFNNYKSLKLHKSVPIRHRGTAVSTRKG